MLPPIQFKWRRSQRFPMDSATPDDLSPMGISQKRMRVELEILIFFQNPIQGNALGGWSRDITSLHRWWGCKPKACTNFVASPPHENGSLEFLPAHQEKLECPGTLSPASFLMFAK